MLKTYIRIWRCKDCGKCEELFPGFKSKYNGTVSISKHRYANSSVLRADVEAVVNCCPHDCIGLY